MSFVDDDGNIIECKSEFALTKQGISLFSGTIKGDVSINFSIDNNSVNRKILGYYGPQATNQVAFSRQSFSRMRNGSILDRGYIVIQNEDDDNIDCFYLSGNSNWVQLLQGFITELDLTDYISQWTIDRVQEAPTSGTIFCFADWIAGGNRGSKTLTLLAPAEIQTPDNWEEPRSIPDFYPCFYLHTLVTEIAEQNGLKISGNLVNDALYKSKVIGPKSAILSREVTLGTIVATGTSSLQLAGVETLYPAFTEVSDPDGLFASSKYTANKKTGIIFYLTNDIPTPSTTNYVVIKKNGVAVFYYNYVNSFANNTPVTYTHSIPCNPGDVFEFYVRRSVDSVTTLSNLRIYEAKYIWPRDWVDPTALLPKLKCIDIINYIVKFFGCSAYYDSFSKTLELNIIDKIKKEDALDWSDRFIGSNKDYGRQTNNNYITWNNSGASAEIERYNNKNKVDFGAGNIETGKDAKEERYLMNFPFIPADTLENINEVWLADSSLLSLSDSESLTYTAFQSADTVRTSYTNIGFGDTTNNQVISSYEFVKLTNGQSYQGIHLSNLILVGGGQLVAQVYDVNAYTGGRVIKQSVSFITSNKIFSVRLGTALSDISGEASKYVMWETPLNTGVADCTQKFGAVTNSTQITTCNWLSFTKPETGKPIDIWKNNLAIDNPYFDNGTRMYKDQTINELYYKNIGNIIRNPTINAVFRLSETDFKNFVFDRFVYLKTEKLTGYFYIASINNFKDGNTPVTVNLYML